MEGDYHKKINEIRTGIKSKIKCLRDKVANSNVRHLLFHSFIRTSLHQMIDIESGRRLIEKDEFALPVSEYIQLIIARVKRVDSLDVSPEDFDEVYDLAREVIIDISRVNFLENLLGQKSYDYASFRRSENLISRKSSYSFFDEFLLRFELEPYSDSIEKEFGIDYNEIVKVATDIKTHTSRYMERLEKVPNNLDQFLDDISITKIANTLPPALLQKLSFEPGEFNSEDTLMNYPISVNRVNIENTLINSKPFLKLDEEYFYILSSSLYNMDGLTRNILAGLETDRTLRKKAELFEGECFRAIENLFCPQISYPNAFYINNNSEICEVDGIFYADNLLVILEVKSGKLNDASKRGIKNKLEEDINKLIIDGSKQLSKAEKYIVEQKSEHISFVKADGKALAINIPNQIDQVIKLIVTKEHMGWIGANLNVSKRDQIDSNTIHISFDDLLAVEKVLDKQKFLFDNYLLERIRTNNTDIIRQYDELDHLALFLKENNYSMKQFENNSDHIWHAYATSEIDDFFTNLLMGKDAVPPTQYLSTPLKTFLVDLSNARIRNGRLLIRSMLEKDTDGREKLLNAIFRVQESFFTRQRPTTVKVVGRDESLGISIIHALDPMLDIHINTAKYSLIKMRKVRWLIVIVEGNEVTRIQSIVPKDVTEKELKLAEIFLDQKVTRDIKKTKIGRNEWCPCGSGLKYKKCHLKKSN